MYFDLIVGKIVFTYLALVEMEAYDADAIQKADNASVMVGINKGVYTKLNEKVRSLIHIPCVYNSLQLAVSAAASTTLPRNIDYLIKKTYN